ncbi:hypothetical protein HPB48_001795 [Haemaphysalis longicornis]|uniref:Cuticular protein n=1 Tax=Haemaphysalis longicornis TaxID=44386 RepID=A0A9J6GSE2_HAELO|nr:hypothetical protein HPB48_001795 [Haemaphysalis longicornis]
MGGAEFSVTVRPSTHVLLSCWFAAEASGQKVQQQQEQQPYYRDALPRSAPAIPRYYPPAPVHYVSIGDKLDGEYKFGYDSGTGPAGQSYRQEFRLPDGSIQGSYGYVDSRGHMRKVYYSAGKGGFVILKDERILDKETGKAEPLVTTPGPRKVSTFVQYLFCSFTRRVYLTRLCFVSPQVEDVVPEEQEVLQREPQTQHQTRRAAPVAPVPLPQKTAQEIQAEYARSQLFAEPTVARQQYAEPDAEAPPATEAPPPKPRPSRPRTGRRRYEDRLRGYQRPRPYAAVPAPAPVVDRMLLSYNIGTGYYV